MKLPLYYKFFGFFVLIPLLFMACNNKSKALLNSKNTVIAQEEIRNLKEGTLVVRVPMQRNKQEQLQKLIDSDKGSKAVQKRALNQLNTVKEEVASFVSDIDMLMKKSYRFSSYLLIPDYNYAELLDGKRSGIFMDHSGDLLSDSKLETDFIVLQLDSYFAEKNLIFVNSSNNPIPNPFPKVKKNVGYGNGFVRFMKGFIGQSKIRNYAEAIRHINVILTDFYATSNDRMGSREY